jgi:hypothetical protein
MLAIKSGDKKGALRHARRLKVLTTSKGKCETFVDRIDEVLTSIADAEATRKASYLCFTCRGCTVRASTDGLSTMGEIVVFKVWVYSVSLNFSLSFVDEVWTWSCRLPML